MTLLRAVTASIAFAIAVVFASISTSSAAHAQWATVGSPTGNPTYCYGNCGGRAQQRNVRMPWTQQNVHGRQAVIMPQQRQKLRYQSGYQHRSSQSWQKQSRWSKGGAAQPRPNPAKEKYLADCAAHGAPVQQLGGGRMNCHREPSVVTIID